MAELPALRPSVQAYLTAGGQERADAARYRRAILDAARDLMRGEAVPSVSMTDIAVRAGVGQGTLYRKFPAKGHVAAALLAEAMLDLEGELLRRRDAGEEPEALLRWFVARLAGFVAERADLVAVTMSKQDMATGWHEQTGPVIWIVHVLATLFVASGAVADTDDGLDRARMLLPHFLMPGDLSAAPARTAYSARIERLLQLLINARCS